MAAGIEAHLAAFEAHKEDLLAILRNMHGRDPKSEPFDAERASRGLTHLAGGFFWRERIKQEMVPAGECVARLRELAMVLGKARGMLDKAWNDEVGGNLFSAWCEEKVRYDLVPTDRIDDEFDKVVANLADLETAALRAADQVPERRGRPKGTVLLPWEFIATLAEIYQSSTELKPGAGDGPFARFVYAFITALGRANIEYDSIVDA